MQMYYVCLPQKVKESLILNKNRVKPYQQFDADKRLITLLGISVLRQVN
jgi:hypothetical protein